MAQATVDAYLLHSPYRSSVTSVSTTFDTNEVGLLRNPNPALGLSGCACERFMLRHPSGQPPSVPPASCLASVHYLLTVHTDCLVLTYVHVSYNSAAHSYVPPSAIA
jgi:hypothetical protein